MKNKKEEGIVLSGRRLILNGKRMDTRERAHAHLAKRLHLPPHYGGNLDALNDCLGEIGKPTRILLRNTVFLRVSLGDYGERILNVLTETAAKNEQITFEFREGF